MSMDPTISRLLDYYADMLPEKQRFMMDCCYNQDFSLAEIAENVGITRQGVWDTVKRGAARLKRLEARLGLAAADQALQDALAQITCLCTETLSDAGATDNVRCRVGQIAEITEKLQK